MKKYVIIIVFFMLNSLCVNAQEYQFINSVVTPYEGESAIPLDTLFLNNRFIEFGDEYLKVEYDIEQLIRFQWSYRKMAAPVELFLKNFSIKRLQSEIKRAQGDSEIDFKALNNYFFPVNEEFINSHRRKKYLSISKPLFNKKKDWCVIIKYQYIPYTDTGGNKGMYIYVKVDDKWFLYNTITLSLT